MRGIRDFSIVEHAKKINKFVAGMNFILIKYSSIEPPIYWKNGL